MQVLRKTDQKGLTDVQTEGRWKPRHDISSAGFQPVELKITNILYTYTQTEIQPHLQTEDRFQLTPESISLKSKDHT